MTSKKNRNLTRNLADEKQRFGIRKFSIGVASVLLGTSLMFGTNTQIARADSENGGVNSTTETTSEIQPKSKNDAANTAKVDQSKTSAEDKSTSSQEINNKKTESLEKKTDDSSLTTQESNQVQKDQSDNVTKNTNKHNQDSNETTTLNLQSAQPVAKFALKESKAAEPTKQVTATLKIGRAHV